ncbi:MAG: peptidoglycan editing factor PgeF [Thermomicrobiales bacterium]|nr:peptidoglycan editing factor PgeF [Thermomicrobiales bacterium]MCO5225034.1 peptidoglycan editing factor PgeF [Thermomicrobiales bacterium]MCO5227863.1 peptidoglycan editing factor PgeF [Thermomicrobiales bacterium]
MTDTQPTPLLSELLSSADGIVHGVTRRVAGMGVADGNVGSTAPRDPEDAWQMRIAWCKAIGVDPERIVRTDQIHSNQVFVVREEHAGMGRRREHPMAAVADSTITQAVNVPLMTLAADCLPLLMYDPAQRGIAAVHAGWRGTVIDIAGETVRAMQREFGTDPNDLLAYLGPSIGGCCNEVGPEVTAAWREIASDLGPLAELAVTKPGVKEHFDVPRANALLLQRAGVKAEHIEFSNHCTKCDTEHWFSHRGQGAATGRQAGVIMLTGSVA